MAKHHIGHGTMPRPPICTECGDVMAREWVEFDGCWVRAWLCMCSDDEKKPEEPAAWVMRKRHRNTEKELGNASPAGPKR